MHLIALYSGFRLKRPRIRRPIGYKDQSWLAQGGLLKRNALYMNFNPTLRRLFAPFRPTFCYIFLQHTLQIIIIIIVVAQCLL